MSVHYKFKSAVEYDTLPVDGLNISLGDLKESIIQQKRLGKGQPYDLQITNAETKEVYTDEKILIPKNSSLIVARVPIDPSQMKRPWENKDATALILANPSNLMNTEDAAEAAEIDRKIKEVTDLTRMEGSEQDKINAMVAQSTMDYHPSKYVKLRSSKMTGMVPYGYKCYKCNKAGHWVTMCPLNNQDLRKSTGIPTMFLEEVEDPNAPGVMITQKGKLVRLRDLGGDSKAKHNPPVERTLLPDDLECQLCKEVLKDAVLIPCCAAAYCDDCIRNHLLDSEEHVCPACGKEGIGPDTLIPNRYLRIKVQQFECGWIQGEKRHDGSSDGGESLSSVPPHVLHPSGSPTPPHSPAHFPQSPARIRISDKLMKSPISQTATSPVSEKSPARADVPEPLGNGDDDKEESAAENFVVASEIHDASGECGPPAEVEERTAQTTTVEEKENIEVNEKEVNVYEKQKKTKRKKEKRKSSRHESEEERDEKKRKKKDRSHKSQDKKSSGEKKSKHHAADVLKDVDLSDDKSDRWDNVSHETDEDKKVPSRSKYILKDVSDEAQSPSDWRGERERERSENHERNRSRSRSGETNDVPVYDNIIPFNPHVPPPNFVKSPPQGYQYPMTSAYPPVIPSAPLPTDTTYSHYQPGLIADPLTEFQKHMREKDERDRKWRYSRSGSPSRSPRYRRVRSRSRQRSWSRSRSRSMSRSRGGLSARSPCSQSRRRWSRTPPPRSHTYRSRSPSFSRERSISNRSLSLSRTPSPNRRIGTSPLHVLPVHPSVHPQVYPDPHILARPPMDFGIQRDFNRFPISTLPQDQYQTQPPFLNAPPGHWDQPARFNQGRIDNFKSNFRGRRGRGGFRQGDNFDHRNQDYRYQDFRSQRPMDDSRGLRGAGGWEREGRQSFNTDIPRADRNNRHFEGERRRHGDTNEFDDSRSRRHDDHHLQNKYSDEEWRYSDESRKRDEADRRRYDSRRGRDDRRDESEVSLRKGSDVDDYDDFKRSKKDSDSKNYERSYKDDDRSSRHERDSKHKSSSRRESPREDDLHFRSKSYDSPGKNHKKSPLRDRREKENDRRERDYDRRDREVDKRDIEDKRDRESDSRRDRESDRRDRDSDRRDWETGRRERDSDKRGKESDRRDERRERDLDKQETDPKDYDKKDIYKRDKDQDRKLRDIERKDRDGDRRGRDTSKHDRDPLTRDNIDKSDEDTKKERSYSARWDSVETKNPDREAEHKSKSQEMEVAYGHEEKEHKRKSRRKEGKDEAGREKEKGDGASENDMSKLEKKKHDKKKRRKDKRRASQASTEASQGEVSGDEGEDKRKKKKRDKKRKTKSSAVGEGQGDDPDKVLSEKVSESNPIEPDSTGLSEGLVEKEPEEPLQERSPDHKQSDDESPATQLPLPPLSKWERDEELTLTPKGLSENKAPEEEKKVTVDILKRAENTIFSGRGLVPRKVFLDPQKQKEKEEEEQSKSPTPEWERLEHREAKRRGPSIQITISSKTESQIGRPRGGRYQSSNPENNDQKRYTLRSRRGSEAEKVEKQSRSQKCSQSPSEAPATTRSRRKSEKDNPKEEKDNDNFSNKIDIKSECSTSEDKLKDDLDSQQIKSSTNDKEMVKECDIPHESEEKLLEETLGENLEVRPELPESTVKQETMTPYRGVKRPSSSSADELEIKKLKTEEPKEDAVPLENKSELIQEDSSNVNEMETVTSTVSEYPMQEENNMREELDSVTTTATIRTVLSNPMTIVDPELEDGEIPSDSSGEEVPPQEAVIDTPLELRGIAKSDVDDPEKTAQLRYSPIRVPSPIVEESNCTEMLKVKEKTKKRKKRKRSSSSSSSNSSSSSSSSSSEDEEIIKKKKKKKKKKKAAVLSESSDGESQRKHKKKKKDKKKKKKKSKKKSDK